MIGANWQAALVPYLLGFREVSSLVYYYSNVVVVVVAVALQ